jgi:4-diphosphocytidyl-2C-methyl-D-erythritol kinase
LVEGRGERVTPLGGLRGAPGILLVTPAVPVSTPDVFAAFAAIRGTGDGSVRSSSVHLASELGSGLSAADLAARAGVMAAANDLLPAVALVLPELVPFRRALTRLLHRPIGLSGSGPTLWAIYPSLPDAAEAATMVSAAIADRSLGAPGDAPPFVTATTIASTLINLDPKPSRRTDP